MNEVTTTGTSTPIKKGNNDLGDLVRDMNVPAPERERRVRIEGDAWLEETLQKYESSFDLKKTYKEISYDVMSQSLPVLTSEQINQFIEATIEYEEHENYLDRTGLFATALIQTAYNAGFNDFVLEPKGTQPLNWIGVWLEGTQNNPIRLTNNAQTGKNCGALTKHSTITNNAQTGDYCGHEAEHSTITNNAQTGDYCGYRAEHSTITNNAKTEDNCGLRAEHSTFKTNNPETLKEILRDISNLKINLYLECTDTHSGNKIIFIHPDGTEEVIKDYE